LVKVVLRDHEKWKTW